ncbi:hypothetical protein D3C76_1306410 [compost metagenome]
MKVRKRTISIPVIGQAAVAPVPALGEVLRTVMPLYTAARRAERFGEFAASTPRIEFTHKGKQRSGKILSPQENTAERPFVQRMMLIIGEAFFPVLDQLEDFTCACGVAHQAQVTSNTSLMS